MAIKDNRIVVDVVGDRIVAIGKPGNITVNSNVPEYVKRTKANMKRRTTTRLIHGSHEPFPTGSETFLEIAAAMVAAAGWEAIIVEAPQEVIDVLKTLVPEGKLVAKVDTDSDSNMFKIHSEDAGTIY